MFDPSTADIAAFLQEVSGGGPTAASGVFHALKWWATTAGFPFNDEHPAVRDWRFHAPKHAVAQALELQPWEFMNLLPLQEQSTGAFRLSCPS